MNKKAFTLLELVVALAIFSIGMLAVLRIFPINRRFLTQSTNTTRAAFLAQEEMEYIHSVDYENLSTGNFESSHVLSSDSADTFSLYSRQTSVSLIDSNYGATSTDIGLKKVVTTISWTENNLPRTYSISTYVQKK